MKTVIDVKVFVPAKDFSLSKSFYQALGWELKWEEENGRLAILELADNRFYLQNFYVKEWAHNFMLHISVEDVQACYEQAQELLIQGQFPGMRVVPPKDEGYAMVCYVWDPCGVLLHFAQLKS